MTAKRVVGYAAPLIFIVVALAVWQLAVDFRIVSTLLVPRPIDVATSIGSLISTGLIWEHLAATTFETVSGFAIGATAGAFAAAVAGSFDFVRRGLMPLAVALQVTPLIAIAPLIVAWAGFGFSSKIVIAAVVCFFPVFVNTLAGIAAAEPEEREMFRSVGATRMQMLGHLMIPRALPLVFAGLKTALTLALIGAVVGEFIAGQVGLGLLTKRLSGQLSVDGAFAVITFLTALGLTLYALAALAEYLIVFWRHDSRMAARTRRRQRTEPSRTVPREDLAVALATALQKEKA